MASRLEAFLEDPDAMLRMAAAAGLCKLKARGSVPDLCKLREDPDGRVRRVALVARVRLGDLAAGPDLVALLEQEEAETAFVAYATGWNVEQTVLPTSREAVTLILIQQLQDPETRRAAIATLGLLKDARAAKLLAKLLEDPDEAVRKEAAQALSRIRGE